MKIAQCRNLLLVSWFNAPLAAQLREVARFARAAGRRNLSGIGLMNMIHEGKPRFSDEARDEAARLNKDPTIFPLGVANVVLASGLIGVTVRAFLNTVALIGRPVVPTKAFSTVLEGAQWMAPKLSTGGEKWTPEEIVAATKNVGR